MNESVKGDEFDDVRKIRNSVNYYGGTLAAVEAVKIIASIKSLRRFVSDLLQE